MSTVEQAYRSNLREIRRLQLRIAQRQCGRNEGATFAALDRRLGRDAALLARLAEEA